MKKFLFLFLVFFFSHKELAQVVFCPVGAEWHYSFFLLPVYEVANEEIKYVRDSIIGNETGKVLLHSRYFKWQNFGANKLTLIMQKGDTIFFRNSSTQHTWQILYNFSTPPGQGWINNISTFSPSSSTPTPIITYTITVNSVSNTIVNSMTLKQMSVTYSSYSFPNPNPNLRIENVNITERLGCSQFLFNFYNVKWVTDSDVFSDFLCYQDNSFGLKQFTNYTCDYQDYVGIPENNYQNFNIKIYPNSANDFFIINTENEMLSGESIVFINDLSGRAVKQINLNSLNSEKINIAGLASGIYILNITNNDVAVYTGKLVKVE